jgi:hypothetical protein
VVPGKGRVCGRLLGATRHAHMGSSSAGAAGHNAVSSAATDSTQHGQLDRFAGSKARQVGALARLSRRGREIGMWSRLDRATGGRLEVRWAKLELGQHLGCMQEKKKRDKLKEMKEKEGSEIGNFQT